jgi:hypothetical protein
MTARQLFGLGLFIGVGVGQTFAWLTLREHCPNAPGMTALSTFGPGMSVVGTVRMIYLFLKTQ